MKYLTCYKVIQADNPYAGGIGQGGGGYWQEDVGIRLQAEIGRCLGAEVTYHARPHGRDSFDVREFNPGMGFDAAYVQLFDPPMVRPAKVVWSIISDYVGMEEVLERFLERVKPDFIIAFQYPTNPPTRIESVPNIRPQNLIHQCEKHGCKVYHRPWFNTVSHAEFGFKRDIAAMCTGKMSGTYPHRDAIFKYLERMQRDDIVLSGNPHGSTFNLSDEDYHTGLCRARYYVTGGIYDFQVPPKYYEVANYGATIVSFDMPMMGFVGFVPGQTYVQIRSLEEIPAVLESDVWKRIGREGRAMVHRRHSMEIRAAQIAEHIKDHLRGYA